MIESLLIGLLANIVTDAGKASLNKLFKDESVSKEIEKAYKKALQKWSINTSIIEREQIWSRKKFELLISCIKEPSKYKELDNSLIELISYFKQELQKSSFVWNYITDIHFQNEIEKLNKLDTHLENLTRQFEKVDIIESKIPDVEQLFKKGDEKLSLKDFKSALLFYDKAQILSEKIKKPSLIVKAICNIAQCYFFLREKDKAILIAQNAIEVAKQNKDCGYVSIAYQNLAQIFEFSGNVVKAYETIKEGHVFSENNPQICDPNKTALTLISTSIKTKKYKEAKEVLDKYYDGIKRNGIKEEILLLELEGLLQISNNKKNEGQSKIGEAIKKALDNSLIDTAYELTKDLASSFVKSGKLKEAQQLLNDILEENLSELQECNLKFILAESIMLERNFDSAKPLFNDVLLIAQKNKFDFFIGGIYLDLAQIYIEEDDYDSGFENIEKALNHFEQINDKYSIIEGLIVLGKLFLKNHISKYSSLFLDKFNIYKTYKNIHPDQNYLEQIAFNVYDRLGDFAQQKKLFESYKDQLDKQMVDETEVVLDAKIHRRNIFETVLNTNTPEKLAGTDGANSLNEANRWVLGPLLDWYQGTEAFHGLGMGCTGLGLIYDLWGQANFTRLMLNARTHKNYFHLTIDVDNVQDARNACRIFLPITDCLTLIWKGNLDIGSGSIPRHSTLGTPEKNWKPKTFDSARLYPMTVTPLVCCTLPYDILNFYFTEARPFIEKGKLILAPGPMIGCPNLDHNIQEEIYCKITNGFSIQNKSSKNRSDLSIPLVYPYFPKIDLSDLSKIIEDEKEGLYELRKMLLTWSCEIEDNDFSELKKKKFEMEFSDVITPVVERFEKISKKIKNDKFTLSSKEVTQEIESTDYSNHAINSTTAESTSLLFSSEIRKEISNKAGLACFRLMGLGKKWELRGSQISVRNPKTKQIVRPEIFNWLKMPGEINENIKTMFVKDSEK